jgi:hypothetical protein
MTRLSILGFLTLTSFVACSTQQRGASPLCRINFIVYSDGWKTNAVTVYTDQTYGWTKGVGRRAIPRPLFARLEKSVAESGLFYLDRGIPQHDFGLDDSHRRHPPGVEELWAHVIDSAHVQQHTR